MSWQKFILLKQRSVNKISITASSTFNFHRKFYEDNSLGNFKYVVVYYDKDVMSIGFNFTNNEQEKYKFTIQKNGKGYGGFISATSFFKSNDLDVTICKGRHDWSLQEIEGIGKLFVIKLKNQSQETTVVSNIQTQQPQT